MKILLENLVLARGAVHCEFPENFKIQGVKELQVVSLIRAKEVKIFDRGNSQITITFKVTRQHNTANEARLYVMEHTTTALALHGKAYFELEDGASTCFALQDASVRHLSGHIDGLLSHYSYEIIGSKIKIC